MTDSRDEQVENAAKAMSNVNLGKEYYREMARAALPHFQQTADEGLRKAAQTVVTAWEEVRCGRAEISALKAALSQPHTEGAQNVYTLAEIESVANSISVRLNNHLGEMKPEYDDSIVGFNEASDLVRGVFRDFFDGKLLFRQRLAHLEPEPARVTFKGPEIPSVASEIVRRIEQLLFPGTLVCGIEHAENRIMIEINRLHAAGLRAEIEAGGK